MSNGPEIERLQHNNGYISADIENSVAASCVRPLHGYPGNRGIVPDIRIPIPNTPATRTRPRASAQSASSTDLLLLLLPNDIALPTKDSAAGLPRGRQLHHRQLQQQQACALPAAETHRGRDRPSPIHSLAHGTTAVAVVVVRSFRIFVESSLHWSPVMSIRRYLRLLYCYKCYMSNGALPVIIRQFTKFMSSC